MEGQTLGGGGNWGYPPYPGYNTNANANANANENQFMYDARSAPQQLQLFGNNAVGTGGYYNYNGNVNVPVMNQARKTGDYTVDEKKLKLQMSLNNNADGLPCNSSVVSTGLKLSYEDNERNSATTSGSESMSLPTMTPFVGDIMAEMEKGNKVIDDYFRIQVEQLSQRVREMQKKQMIYFMSSLSRGAAKKLREKELQLEAVNRRSQDLKEQSKQLAVQAQSWQQAALYNESVTSNLKSQLMQVVAEHANRTREGRGDSEESAAPGQNGSTHANANMNAAEPGAFFESSLLYGGNGGGGPAAGAAACRWCGAKDAVVLAMPCRHLCLCVDCEGVADTCPVCHFPKSGSVEINMS